MAKQINFGGALLKQFGAYIRTDLTGLVDINGVASGIIGLVGLAEKGPVDEAVTINGYTQLVETFGDGPLVRHGLAAYVGGASQLVCVRTGAPSAAKLTAIDAGATPLDYTWESKELGSLGDNIFISVEEQDPDGDALTLTDTNYAIRLKYIDSRGNDIRETFVLPKYIPGRFYFTGASESYYVLRERETGVIRDVPGTWTFGNIDLDAFLSKVEDLKSTTEDLIGPFPFGTGDNPYPLVLISSVINNGGFGLAPSNLVTLGDVDPAIEDILAPGYTYNPATADEMLEHPFVQLSGGNNGDDGTNFYGIVDGGTGDIGYDMTYSVPSSTSMDAWDASLSIMEDEDVNFIQPAYLFNYKRNTVDNSLSDTFEFSQRYGFFKTLMPKFLSHITTMSSIANRRFRTMVAGLPYYKTGSTVAGTAQDFLDAIEDISGLINNDRVQLWAGGFHSRAFSSKVENYGGEMLASFAVGAHAAREVSVSLTFAQLSGIFTDGLEFAFNQAQKDELYTRSLDFVMKRRNSVGAVEYVAAHNYTSFTGASSRGLQLFITRRIVDYMNTFVYKNLEENFIGRASRGADTARAISEFVSALLNRLIREDVLVAVANVTAWADENDKTIYYVEYDFQPVTEIDFIAVTNKLLYNLA